MDATLCVLLLNRGRRAVGEVQSGLAAGHQNQLFVLLGPSFILTSWSGSGEFPAIYRRLSIFP